MTGPWEASISAFSPNPLDPLDQSQAPAQPVDDAMTTKIFVAGATGVIGRTLIPLLGKAGFAVTGMTRTEKGRAWLEAQGAAGVIVDVFDAEGICAAVQDAAPSIVINQLTDLPDRKDLVASEDSARRNARIRREGTANLVRAARSAGVRRVIAQSIGWAYAPKAAPFSETDPLDLAARGQRAITICEGVVPLESAVLNQNDFQGLVLRFGQLYGPGTWSINPSGTAPVHVEAAAHAALLAVDHGGPGAYNIAEPGGALDVGKAHRELGWRSHFRLGEQILGLAGEGI